MRISVALCTYNGAKYLDQQLTSLAEQTRPPDELVVCDDRSTDGTLAVLDSFARRANFPVRIFSNEQNLGSTKNFEKAVGLCDGDIIALCDQDDCWLPEKLAKMAAVFEANADIGLVISDSWLAGPNLEKSEQRSWPNLPFTPAMQRQFREGFGPKMMLRYNLVTGAAAAFRADLRDVVLPIPTCWVHDGWIGFLATAFRQAEAIAEPLLLYRQHGNQQIGIPRLTLGRQFQFARTMNLAYFQKQRDCFVALAGRLERFRDGVRDPSVLDAVRGKVALSEVQVRMRQSSRFARIAMAGRQLVAGNYHRYARGVKSLVVDTVF